MDEGSRTHERQQLRVAFESARLSYSDHPVDLYNSGVNQLLSLAAVRGHELCHYRMADLYRHREVARARVTTLVLDDAFNTDPLNAHQYLRPSGTVSIELADLDLHFVRGDDIRRSDTPNLGILRSAEAASTVIETVDATLGTCDKYELVRRCPEVPQPVTFAVRSSEDALEAVSKLPDPQDWFVLKDRFGYGCGAQVHRLRADLDGVEHIVHEYVRAYGDVLIQEYRSEVTDGDLVATFFDEHLLGTMRRIPAEGEWKTNASLGADQVAHELSDEQETSAWAVRRAFPECRLISVDLLSSGRVLEVNAFPGGDGLLTTHGVVLAEVVLDRLEAELAGNDASATGLTPQEHLGGGDGRR